jgi:SAM-dependent methyltransferase
MDRPEDEDSESIVTHYEQRYREEDRLTRPQGRLEYLRTMELLARFLPASPAVVLDVGGASGAFATPLAQRGYQVHLIDPMPRHLELARLASERASTPFASIEQGDARDLRHETGTIDAVLMLGPLYHLTEGQDRLQALREAHRVLRRSGAFFGAGVSRFASTYDGLAHGFVMESAFERIVERDVAEGQHRNPDGRPEWFTTAFFHHPDELRKEAVEAGFEDVAVFAVEGPGWFLTDLGDWLDDAERREVLLRTIRRVETELSIVGASPHLLVVGRKR